MSRVSIEVTPEQHQRLKARAALAGKTIKAYMLEQALPPVPDRESLSEADARRQLEAFLQPRLEAAERGEVVNQSVPASIDALQQERRARRVCPDTSGQAGCQGQLALYGKKASLTLAPTRP